MNLSNLKVLDLSLNRFSKGFPEVVCKVASLQELNLSSSGITGLPARYMLVIYLRLGEVIKNIGYVMG